MKKLLSVLLVVSMMLATGSFSVAADTATVETNTGVTLSLFDGVLYKSNGTVNSATLASAGNFYPNPNNKVITTQYGLRSTGLGTGVSSVTEGDNAYYSVNWSDIQNNTRFNLNEYMTNNPVVSVSYDVRIPEADSDKWRQTEIRFSSDGANTNNLALVCVKYDDNRFFIDEDTTSGIDCVNSKTKTYSSGDWVTVETRVYRNTDNKIDVGVYVGEEQIYYGEGTGDYTDNLALRQINFKTETTASGDTSVTYTTHYDDIKVSMLPQSYIPVDSIVSNKNLSHYDGVLYNSKGTANNTTLTSGKYFYPNPDCEVIDNSSNGYALRSAGCGTGVSSVTEDDNAYFSVNWSDIQNNFRYNLGEYITSNNPVLSFSYDIRIPEADSDKWRKTDIRLTSDGLSGSENLTIFCIKYDDNTLYVSEDGTSGVDTVNSRTKSYTAGSWINVETRIYRNADNKIDVGVYVGEEKEQIYYGKGTNDYTDNLAIRQLNFVTETNADATATYTTDYDNIDVSVLVAEYIPEPMIMLNLSETSSGVECKANISTGENLCLVAAVFDGNNKLQKMWTDTTLDNNALSIPISDEQYLKTGYEIKAFLFDSLQSAIPQVESKSITLTSK